MVIQGEFFELPRVELAEVLEAPAVAARRGMKDLSIPKLYYSISEVSRLAGLEQHVLRYWETEFDDLRPQKNRAGNRIYSNKDIKLILKIKELLREKRYTIDGAKQILREQRHAEREQERDAEREVDREGERSEPGELAPNSMQASPTSDPDQMAMVTSPEKVSVALRREEISELRRDLERVHSILTKRP